MRETALIHADSGTQQEWWRLTETGPDTGVFAGGFPQNGQGATATPCDLHLKRGDRLTLSIDENDDHYGRHLGVALTDRRPRRFERSDHRGADPCFR